MTRHARPGALFAMTTWGPPQQCDMREVFGGLGPWRKDIPRSGDVAIGAPGTAEALAEEDGFDVVAAADVVCPFRYDDLDQALRGLLAAAPFIVAGRERGDDVVRQRVAGCLDRFRRADGAVRLDNVFRWVVVHVR